MSRYQVSVGRGKPDREEIIDFLSKIFGPDYSTSRIVQQTIFDAEPSISQENLIMARSEQGDLIGLVRIVERSILLDVSVLSAGCVSSVGVKSEWRGQGIASELMNKAIEVMTSRGMDISLVYGRRAVDGFYPRFGYYGVGRYVDLEIISPLDSKSFINVLPYKKDDLKKCMEFYNETYSALSGSVLRDRPVWEYLFLRMERGIGGFKLFICLENQKAIGYLVVFDNRLIELSLPRRVFPSVAGLLNSLNIRLISIHPRHPFYIYCFTQMNTVQKIRFTHDGGYMARILNPGALLKKLGPSLVSRAANIGVSDKVVSLLNYECALGSGKISEASGANNISFEKIETAIQFVLGVIPSQDIIGVKWTDEKPWIPHIFPELYYHTSAWDEV